jgi:hypothetical protein
LKPAFALLVVGAACVLPGCLSFGYMRELRESPPDSARVAALEPGSAGLGDALAALGAPLYVWEAPRDGVVLAYGGLRERRWGVEVSVPVGDQGSASFAYDDGAARTVGHVLVFDGDLRLILVREGNLRDLRREFARRRPASTGFEEPRAEGGGS